MYRLWLFSKSTHFHHPIIWELCPPMVKFLEKCRR
jgi:hypothetical protein